MSVDTATWTGNEIVDAIRRHAKDRAEVAAIEVAGRTLSYAELATRMDAVAAQLEEAGVGQGSVVGHCFERTEDALVAILAILEVGAAYVPVDPRYPMERVSYSLHDADVSLIVAGPGATSVSDAVALPTLVLEGDELVGSDRARSGRKLEDVAYVVYTSGSTGRPKGVAVGRAALAAYAETLGDRLGIEPTDRYLHTASFAFSSSVRQWVLPLTRGATIVLAEREDIGDARALLDLVRKASVTVVDLVPSYLAGCVQALEEEDAGVRRTLLDNELRLVLTASEPFPAVLARRWRKDLAHPARMINMFGQTETAGIATTFELPEDLSDEGIVPIGVPLPIVTARVVDESGAPVGPGASGELLLSGPSLGMGYVGLEETTAERFFEDEDGVRWYRSGDNVRQRAEGVLEFVGRRDTQVKVRGQRVELEEVEARLSGHPSVQEAAVMAQEGADGQAMLVATVVPAQGATLDPWALRRFVSVALPDYMVPAAVRATDAIPRTPNGKIDRSALPELDAERLELSRAYVEPSGDDEILLAGHWRELLGVPRVGVNDDFFELGGHSLLAMRLMARLRAETSVELPVRVLFERPTVAELASALGEARAAAAEGSARPSLEPRDGHQVVPSFAQRRLWLLHQLDKDSSAYNLLAAIRLRGVLDVSALSKAISTIVERHEALRTTFPSVGGEPTAVVASATSIELDVEDVPDEAALRERVKAEASAPYNLEEGPLFRTMLFRLAEEEHVFFFGMHHIVSDGWSRGVLYDELAQLYGAFRSGAPSPLPALEVQYPDYAAWQRDWFEAEGLEEQESWWRAYLEGAPATSELPTQRPRPSIQSFNGKTLTFPVPEDLTRDIRRLGAEESASPFMIYLAALAMLVGRYNGQDDVVIGSPTAGRAESATEPLVGFFVNTLALRVRLDPECTFRELVRHARTASLEAFGHQDVPFDRVVNALNVPRDLSRSPLFQVMLILQNTPPATHRPAGLAMTQVDIALDSAMYDLTLSLVAGDHGMTGRLEYNTDLFDEQYVDRFGGHFVRLLEAGTESPDLSISDLPLLTSGEEQELLVDWNDTTKPVPSDATIHDLFRAQVARTPGATALVYGDERMTYEELDRRSDQLAHHLRSMGVGDETLVGVCVSRSLEMMVGLFGILKAGGAYVPLDPTYPGARLAHVVEDSGCPIVLSLASLDADLPGSVELLRLDADWETIEATAASTLPEVRPEQAAYCIYTSGSTGRPKGVVVEHRNVVNFFEGMDERVPSDEPITWLAVTSISFDISVLELFWTLARGAEVVIQPDEPQAEVGEVAAPSRSIDFSLFYFASETSSEDGDPYRMLLEGARFGDENGFSAVWVPERHFHEFGGIYPSPAVMGGALAMITENVKIRTGSVVLPLHDTIRVAEDWAVVDTLSKGRVQLSFASGWHDRDFVFQPQNYADRRTVMMHQMEEVKALWRGESVTRKGGEGTPHEVQTHPRPVQSELPIFVTAAGNPETFERAGRAGAHLLTHLLGQTVEQVGEKIQSYRRAWQEAGHEGRGTVALMMHTFVGEDLDEVRELVRAPFREYLRSSVGLISGLAKGRGQDLRSADFTDEDMEALLDHAFERYFETSALMGTRETCLATVERLKALDVDDVACLIDFGIPRDRVLDSFERLAEVHRLANQGPKQAPLVEPEDDDYVAVPAQIQKHAVTHMQCTPSYAEMLLAQPGGRESLGELGCLMVGGEALPLSLARELDAAVGGRVMNMYGPTETTIWSSTDVVDASDSAVSLGRPIANTDLYVVDTHMKPVPVGVPGELLIGGLGVVRGYWDRPELTAERFIDHPVIPGRRAYRTGDLVRYRADGRLDFLGRLDHQVKVRGHRIELGEIESLLREHDAVREAVVVAREDVPGDKRLVGYVVLASELAEAEAELRGALRGSLPEWMVPQHVVVLEAIPLTPNGKTDRAALPAPSMTASTADFVAPSSDVEQVLAEVWADVLRRPSVGVDDNFFDLGGHSLLTVRVQAALKERLDRSVPITDLFRFPTIRSLAQRLDEGASDDGASVVDAAAERAKARRGALARRRGR